MRKLGLVVFVSVAAAATDQLIIQPLLRNVSSDEPAEGAVDAPSGRSSRKPAPDLAFSAPVSGYVADPGGKGARPIMGLRVNAFIGDFLNFGEDVNSIVSSPNQNYLVELGSSGLVSLWIPASEGVVRKSLPGDVTSTSRVVSSTAGFSVALVSESRGLLQIFTGLPNQPQLSSSLRFSDLGGAPKSIALNDHGDAMLFAVNDGSRDWLYSWHKGGAPQLILSGDRVTYTAFAPNGAAAVVTDGGANAVTLLSAQGETFVSSPFADASAGLSGPVAAEFSRDGQKVVVANATSHTLQVFQVDGTSLGSAACNCAPIMLQRMSGNAVFQVSRYDGTSLDMVDADAGFVRVATVGRLATDTETRLSSTAGFSPDATPANAVSALATSTAPSAACSVPGSIRYILPGAATYAWINFTSSVVTSTDRVYAQVRTCSSNGTCTQTTPTGSAVLLTHPTTTSSCFYGSVSIPAGLGTGNYQIAYFVNPTTSAPPFNNEIAIAEPPFSVLSNSVTLSLLGSLGFLNQGGANQQGLTSTLTQSGLPENAAITITPSFSPNSVINAPSGVTNPVYDCRFVQGTGIVNIPAGATTQSPVSVPVSAGTVAGTCKFTATQLTVGNATPGVIIPLTGGTQQMVNVPELPYISGVTQTASGSTLTLQISGWSTRRNLSNFIFTFTPKSNVTIGGGASLTVDVSATSATSSATFFKLASSQNTGGAFVFTESFSVSGGASSNIQSISVTANDSVATSNSVALSTIN